MVIFVFTKKSEKCFLSLPVVVQERILVKLKALKKHDDIFSVLKKLHHLEPATHRLRIGGYRLILELNEHKKGFIRFLVLDVGDRKDIYK
ncbi:hypothetical protein HON58_02025 [Candidatus Peregrinibacteria bacterium]|jgi:mRNA-degrading endonuclease RelE of RelBE toxin-antitoxin system|nr:hypothetical protein [Candidatus Peregrinibacteria bacterium]